MSVLLRGTGGRSKGGGPKERATLSFTVISVQKRRRSFTGAPANKADTKRAGIRQERASSMRIETKKGRYAAAIAAR